MPNYFDSNYVKLLSQSTDVYENVLEVIVKYNGDIYKIKDDLDVDVEVLSYDYAIITLPSEKIIFLYDYPEIEYIERPKNLTLFLSESLLKSCITPVQNDPNFNLKGKGTIVGIIDSGIDYTHPDFINPDGTSRILYIWDQTANGNPPPGFSTGFEYSDKELNLALSSSQPLSIVPPMDIIGHGTAVAGIAAGNGRSSGGTEKGAAPEASLIVVKLGQKGSESFARTTEIMRAIKYLLDKAEQLNMPVAINISFGTNNGSHDGSSLFETFIDEAAQRWKNVIIAAAGNEGSAGHHFSAKLSQGQTMDVNFVTSSNLSSFYITIWKNFADRFTFELISPSGQSTGQIQPIDRLLTKNLDGVSIIIYNGQPTHYNEDQEIFFRFSKTDAPIPEGLWKIIVRAIVAVDGSFDMWLPTTEEVSAKTAFSIPTVTTTLTLPATAINVISVGGYNSNLNSAANFSGRGYTRNGVFVKPDLVAPAVGILSTKIGGGYDRFTGTSMAAPFVAGASALIMEWGIVQNNDPFLYGQRVKAFLKKGATKDKNIPYPNPIWGYGALCLKNTMDFLVEYVKGGGFSI